MNSENMKLWDSVQETNPNFTKGFTRGGGFSGTAINPTYLVHKATTLWGPIGGNWGYEIVAEDYRQGAPHPVGEDAVSHEVIHVVRIKFRHPGGTFESFGQTTFVGRNKNGWFTDEEAPKKSLTDAMTKALSLLGFSADVHLRMYDDSKYVNDLKNKYAEPDDKTKGELDASMKAIADWNSALESCGTKEELAATWTKIPQTLRKACSKVKDEAKSRLDIGMPA